jgi:hypothetical protein
LVPRSGAVCQYSTLGDVERPLELVSRRNLEKFGEAGLKKPRMQSAELNKEH